ncbi:3064_t:CDS:1, partial [Cetraspora pellucida]
NPSTSVQQMYQWHVNPSCPKNNCDVVITTLNNNHNHELSLKAI